MTYTVMFVLGTVGAMGGYTALIGKSNASSEHCIIHNTNKLCWLSIVSSTVLTRLLAGQMLLLCQLCDQVTQLTHSVHPV